MKEWPNGTSIHCSVIDYISNHGGLFPWEVFLVWVVIFSTLIGFEYNGSVGVGRPYLLHNGALNTIVIPDMSQASFGEDCPLPQSVSFVPIPPGSVPTVHWTVDDVAETGWDSSVLFASAPQMEGSGLSATEVFTAAAFPPEHSPVSMDVVNLLGTTLARITVSPFCYGTPGKYARRVSFSVSVEDTSAGRPITNHLLKALCPDSDVWWPHRSRPYVSPFWGKPWARIRVKNTGFYCVTGEELEASDCHVTGVPSASIAMYSGPAEMFDPDVYGDEHALEAVAIAVHDGGDGFFDAADSILFYGRSLWHWNATPDSVYRSFHRYDDTNTYWLTWGGDNGARIGQRHSPAAGGTSVEEGILALGFEEEVFWDYRENRTGWVWGMLSGAYPAYFYLSSPFSSTNATLRLSMVNGATYPAHTVKAELNDVLVLDTLSRDTVGNPYIEYFTLDSVTVVHGGDILKVWNDIPSGSNFNYAELLIPVSPSVSAGYSIIFPVTSPGLYSFEFGSVDSSSLILDVSDPQNPVELTGWTLNGNRANLSMSMTSDVYTLLALNPNHYRSVQSIEPAQPGRILGTSGEADVIITVPENMADELSLLESVYAKRGLSTSVMTYREVYDEFGQGVSDPGAVRSAVRWALDTWAEPPTALLLIGDGSNDPIGYSSGHPTPAPVYVEVGKDACYESFFTTVHDAGGLPEIPVSRISASNTTELLIASQKSAVLEQGAAVGAWSNTVMLAADDEWNDRPSLDARMTLNCEYMADSVIPPRVNIVKLYEIDYPWPPGTTTGGVHPQKPEASADFIAQLNEGVLYTSFFGHGSYDQMTMEKLFASSMVSQLTNAPRYFINNSFSCATGFFDLSAGDCLSEILVFHPDGGAAASMACTRGSYSSANRTLAEEYMSRLHTGDYTIAEALWLSQVVIGNQGNYLYAVIGDGGIRLPKADTSACAAFPVDTLTRGRVNTVDVSFPGEATFLFTCRESADTVTYVSPLAENFSIDYLKYGSVLYSGTHTTNEQGSTSIDFFVPLQADTGALARTQATGGGMGEFGTGYAWPTPLADTGNYTDDEHGPEIVISFPDSQGGDLPTVYQNAVMHAVLSDPSGICTLGDDAGSSVICSVDGAYEDVTEAFSYYSGSYTTGSFDYQIPELLPGVHQVRVVARDGMKNTGEAVLSFNVLDGEAPLLDSFGVYPNPGRGLRAFFFTVSSPGEVEVSVYTVAGRPVWSGAIFVQSGEGQLLWDGRDREGDALAAGVYLYSIGFSGNSGHVSENDVLVVSP